MGQLGRKFCREQMATAATKYDAKPTTLFSSISRLPLVNGAFTSNVVTNTNMPFFVVPYFVTTEIHEQNHALIRLLFKRCLPLVLEMDIWRTYLSYISMRKGMDPKREKVFEYAVKHMGRDVHSLPLWVEYLEYLQMMPCPTKSEKKVQINKIRSVFKRAVFLPLADVEQLWKMYDTWEHKENAVLAKSLLSDLHPRYMLAKKVGKQRKLLRAGVLPHWLARKRAAEKEEEHEIEREKELKQVQHWRAIIKYEQSNPMNLNEGELRSMLIFSFKQALLCLRHHAEIWYEYALALLSTSSASTCFTTAWEGATPKKRADALRVIRQSCEAVPYNVFLHLFLADMQERAAEEHELEEETKQQQQVTKEEVHHWYKDMAKNPLLQNDATIIYCQWMRFARRWKGEDGGRVIFELAQRLSKADFRLYIAAANMEWQANHQQKKAQLVFADGEYHFLSTPSMKRRKQNKASMINVRLSFTPVVKNKKNNDNHPLTWNERMEFASAYFHFLASTGDVMNARALFERVVGVHQMDRTHNNVACPFWRRLLDQYVELEHMHGPLSAIDRAERLRRRFYPSSSFADVTARFKKEQEEKYEPKDKKQHVKENEGKETVVRPNLECLIPYHAGMGLAMSINNCPAISRMMSLLGVSDNDDADRHPPIHLPSLFHFVRSISLPTLEQTIARVTYVPAPPLPSLYNTRR